MCEIDLGREFSQKLKAVHLSDNTESRRISGMSEDVRCQLIARLHHAKFAFQLDECTDIANEAKLLAYFRYFWEGEVFVDALFGESLPGRITVEELFRVLDDFF
ncbi:SCAN domain-containing protein 3 [Thelohanellus kitauei]|uniref:SCAN domain-containing protein 3 n=1 Tax=Thelohanellus kitauei TaxID=669202 RepID=A0A0C2I642_THEKT|nr:SCAN domain-containing protein 3 [Thelohanellus kitauei]